MASAKLQYDLLEGLLLSRDLILWPVHRGNICAFRKDFR